jgi:tetratricopeptide (TPR) repeat protein
MGLINFDRGELDEAIAWFQEAIRIEPAAIHYYSLGLALWKKGRLAEAIAANRRAVEVWRDYAEAHCNLGVFLGEAGQFVEALEHLRLGHELGRQRPDWSHPSDRWVQEAEWRVALDARLPDVLGGQAASADELVELAELCLRFKRQYFDATLLYRKAFAAAPELAQVHRYNAACAAARAAGSSRGDGAVDSESIDRARLRGLALDWLRADLAACGELLAGDAAAAAEVRAQLLHWLADPDLSKVRDAPDLAALPDTERECWTKLWNDLRDLMARTERR